METKQWQESILALTSQIRTYLIFGSFCFTMFFFVWFFVPETKGLSLEAMDTLFGITENSKTDFVGEHDAADNRKQAGATEHEIR